MQELEFAVIPISITLCEMDNNFEITSIKQIKNKTYTKSMYVIPDEIHDVISDSDYEKWASEFKISNNIKTRDMNEMNVYNLINDFNISNDKVSDILYNSFSKKQLDAVMSKDLAKVTESFSIKNALNSFLITVSNKKYDMKYLSTHTIQDYQEVGITTEELKQLLEQMSDYNYTSEYDWIESTYNRMIEDIAPAK